MDWKIVAESLIATGPLAMVLGFAVRVLWLDLKETRKEKDKLYERVMALLGTIAGLEASSEGE